MTRAVADSADPSSMTAGNVASRDVLTVGPDEDLDSARRLMAEQQVRRLPVVQDGRLVGILAQADIALEAGDRPTGDMVEDISRPTSASRF